MSINKKILLIDVDSTIPNIPLMKLSTFYKEKGFKVVLKQLHIPYYPYKHKPTYEFDTSKYYKTYASAIFNKNNQFIKGDNIIFGGTGYDYKIELDEEVEKCQPDYSLYQEKNTTYDFITRGCIRNCYFCVVPKKEGMIHLVKDVNIIIKEAKERGHKNIMFFDNNILAL